MGRSQFTCPRAAEWAVSLPLPRDTPEGEMERRGEDSLSEMVKEGALGRRKRG